MDGLGRLSSSGKDLRQSAAAGQKQLMDAVNKTKQAKVQAAWTRTESDKIIQASVKQLLANGGKAAAEDLSKYAQRLRSSLSKVESILDQSLKSKNLGGRSLPGIAAAAAAAAPPKTPGDIVIPPGGHLTAQQINQIVAAAAQGKNIAPKKGLAAEDCKSLQAKLKAGKQTALDKLRQTTEANLTKLNKGIGISIQDAEDLLKLCNGPNTGPTWESLCGGNNKDKIIQAKEIVNAFHLKSLEATNNIDGVAKQLAAQCGGGPCTGAGCGPKPPVCKANEIVVGKECKSCAKNQVVVGGKCQACPKGQEVVGNQCKAPVKCTGDKVPDGKGGCVSCPKGQVALAGKCGCPDGTMLVGKECKPACGGKIFDRQNACCSEKKIFLGQFQTTGGKCTDFPQEVAKAIRLMDTSAEGAKIAKFLKEKNIPFEYADLSPTMRAQYGNGKIYIRRDMAKDLPVELAASIGHEGYHALHPNTVKSFEDEQDSNFVELAIYHEMIQAGAKRPPLDNKMEKAYENFYGIMQKNKTSEAALDAFNLWIVDVYDDSKLGYTHLANSQAPPTQVRDTKFLHDSREAWAKTWFTKHKKEFK
ncbi:MAG: hypothetical protein HY922_05900 [Elusimicrobia bacterium]|nr:hypothetical protein [Elusimicrobiota bacterium]